MPYAAHADSVDATSLEKFRARFGGELLVPGDAQYEEHRQIWNGAIDRRPGIIARCHRVSDVCEAVRFGREQELLTAVRGGGHSFPGHSVCDGGLLIDLRPMNGIRLDAKRGIVNAQAGCLIGELDRETQRAGSAVPAGIVTHTGIAGLTLGGGLGWIMRKYGLTIDNLLAVHLVTAEGEFLTVDESEHPDLFWALRGGGGNFGIVTDFTYRMQPVGPLIMAGPMFWRMEDTRGLITFYRDWIADCPDELMTMVVQRRAPDADYMPSSLVGEPLIGVVACYTGPLEDAERCLAPLKSFGPPLVDACIPKSFLEHQAAFDPSFQPGRWYYVKSCEVDALNDDIIDVMFDFGMRIESPISSIALWQMGGAVARVGEDATAYQGRNAGHTFNINGNSLTADGFERERQWARDYWSALEPWNTGVYVNFLMEEGQERIREAYPGAKYDRLRAVKQIYDPTNYFHLNQNIVP